jgi:endonuclease/exonuclease/phosphatase family metal-dependent hydrolase
MKPKKNPDFISNLFPTLFFISSLMLISCSEKIEKSFYETDLKVVTFNIRYGTADDGVNSWEFRKNLVFEVIRENYPDILGIQEALNFQISELISELPWYSFAGVGRDDGKLKGEYSAVLYSKDRFILDTTETFWFSDTPQIPGSTTWESTFPRICTWVRLYDKFSKKVLYVYNVHFDHQSKISREKSSDMLLTKILNKINSSPIILMGDFNCSYTNPAIQKILNSGMTDSYRALNNRTNNEGTFNNFTGEKNGDKIDYIFINNKFIPLSASVDHFNRDNKYPSDHFPVNAIIKYK